MGYSYTKDEDRDLVKRILASPPAFRDFIARYQRIVAVMTSRLINNEEDRKDISQDVFLKTYQHLSSFRFQSKLSTWVASITYNTCINFLVKKKHLLYEDFLKDDIDKENSLFEIRDDSAVLQDEWLSSKQVNNFLQEAIEKLPPLFKTLIGLYHSEELSYEEIAEITNLPMGTVKNYLFRARKKLKECLSQQYKIEQL